MRTQNDELQQLADVNATLMIKGNIFFQVFIVAVGFHCGSVLE